MTLATRAKYPTYDAAHAKYTTYDDVRGEVYLPEWAEPYGEVEVTDWLCPRCLADDAEERCLEYRSERRDYHCPSCENVYGREKDISEGYQQRVEAVLGELYGVRRENLALELRLKDYQDQLARYHERFDMIKEAIK